MAFKRYIHKHGKKLGPYYYENVRGSDGKVKTIYLGTSPHHHPKHRIRKPLFFLILALILILILGSSLFFLQNKAYLIKKASLQQADFDVDQILLKVLVKSGEFIEKQVRVMDIGSEPTTINVEASGLDLIKIDSTAFTIKPGQTKIVGLNFSSFMPEQKIEQQPGVYVGKLIVKSEKASKEIPIVVEIETKNVLFDMNLNPVAIERKVKQGSDTAIEVRLFNLQSIESENVDVEYFVKDINGNTIVTESETVVVKTQASFFKTISAPKNLKPGPYIFAAQVSLGNSIGTSSYLFEVTGPEEVTFVQFCKNSVLCLGLSITTILLLFALMAYFYFFIGAYLYEKITGVVTIPRRKKKDVEEEAVEEREGIFERIKNKIYAWKQKRERAKAGKQELETQEELQRLVKQRKSELEARKKQLEEERRKQEEIRRQEELKRKREQEEQRAEEDKKKKEEELRKQKELEARQKEGERKARFKEFFYKIGLYKTPEEKQQVALQKERGRQGKLIKLEELKQQKELQEQRAEEDKKKKEEELRKQKELEARQKEGERRKKQLEGERRKQEEIRRQEELKRKREQEEQRAEEDKKKKEEELRKQKELEARQKEGERRKKQLEEERRKQEEIRRKELFKKQEELERQGQQKIKAEKLEAIKQIEEKLGKNKEIVEQLNSGLKRLESEKDILLKNINETDARVSQVESEIRDKSKPIEELSRQKKQLFEAYKKQLEEIIKKQATEKETKIRESKANLIEKQNVLTKELEVELRKLSPAKRKNVEKWKRMELKAKLKLGEHSLEEELSQYESRIVGKRKAAEQNYKETLREINRKQSDLKLKIKNLEGEKQQTLLEKGSAPRKLSNSDREIEKIRQKLESIAKENEQLNAELKLKAELPKLNLQFFRSLISGYKERAEDARRKRQEEKARGEEEKRKQEELKRQKGEEKPKSEVEELEEAIRSLYLFKKVEGKKGGIKPGEDVKIPKEKKPGIFALFKKEKLAKALKAEAKELPKELKAKIEKKISKKLERCHEALHETKEALGKNEIPQAKKFYVEARNLYIGLSNEEKREVYGELMDVYNNLLK